MQQFIESAVERGVRPRKTANDSVILRGEGRDYKVLVNSTGSITSAGRRYQALGGEELEAFSYDINQTPMRTGNVESIKMRGGKEREVRRYDPATGEYVYTELGKRFYKDVRREYIVKVPAKFVGLRANGRPYERNAFFRFTILSASR